ncbi:nicotinate-nucleotide adenylyltransferase [Oceanobacter sp. 4_MG-2023]|jgi:nicotinate-nucleotide adenylyltransferase|uniref:nicotinate-nucleotide adenylyltransferase n=1 Tax=Oceanobacter sp. 4_MG-2023 TaxID=3062623 RepID=UPI00273463F3|nr:nicotinate-nucleotide adenylyltransferase [Oceanobacter sp. 4_MG-2023]MDP2506581.1 nicotinate-nucleotide adenylyltransferase [Oceanobacter sp. 3_MG-2023]
MSSTVAAARAAPWAILGGTFDPVHIGHLRIALQLRDAGFERVLLMPNRIPPHRPSPRASSSQRLAMLNLATSDLDGVEVSDIELQRPECSYSVITLEWLRTLYPAISFTWAMGTDAWLSFDRWHRCDDILDLANLMVISRPGERQPVAPWQQQQWLARQASITDLLASPAGRICQQAWPGLDISASGLRRGIAEGENVRFLTPDPVLDYLTQHQLYR